jgi:hypothetical protein
MHPKLTIELLSAVLLFIFDSPLPVRLFTIWRANAGNIVWPITPASLDFMKYRSSMRTSGVPVPAKWSGPASNVL